MIIKYKFNKSSESRDCVVESVELNIPEIVCTKVKELTKEEIIEILLNEFDEEIKINLNNNISNIVEEVLHKGLDYDFEQYDYDLYKSYESGIGTMNLEKSNSEITFEIRRGNYGKDVSNVKGVIKTVSIVNQAETKTFTSQQELKEYINTIQEQVEFIAESDIDQVLMKEWIGEWETKQVLNQILGRDYTYWETVYVGSPKLNSNWVFKIK